MIGNKSKNNYRLLITYKIISKSRRYYGVFKPGDVIVSQPCEIYLHIKNIGDSDFPGGRIKKFAIGGSADKGTLKGHYNLSIPAIPKGETHVVKPLRTALADDGTTWLALSIDSTDNKQITYFQWDRINNKAEKIDEYDGWVDFFHVASPQEIHQRYTNYLLLLLTSMTIILFIINLIMLLR